MKLIAKKPCNFCGKQFFIGEEVPANLVLNPLQQISLGVLTTSEAAQTDGTMKLFTQEDVERITAKSLEEADKVYEEQIAEVMRKYEEQLANQQIYIAELIETESGTCDGIIQIAVKVQSDGENEQVMLVPMKPEEIQQVFSIIQANADEGIQMISDVTSENVLILIHASDSRKTVKKAAKERVDHLYSANKDSNESSTDNATTGTNMEGADT